MSFRWMHVAALIACLSSVAASQVGTPLGSEEQQALATLEDGGLEQLRGASGEAPAGLSAIERDSLAQAQAQSAGLSELRAGDLSNHDLHLILITAAIVVVIALLV